MKNKAICFILLLSFMIFNNDLAFAKDYGSNGIKFEVLENNNVNISGKIPTIKEGTIIGLIVYNSKDSSVPIVINDAVCSSGGEFLFPLINLGEFEGINNYIAKIDIGIEIRSFEFSLVYTKNTNDITLIINSIISMDVSEIQKSLWSIFNYLKISTDIDSAYDRIVKNNQIADMAARIKSISTVNTELSSYTDFVKEQSVLCVVDQSAWQETKKILIGEYNIISLLSTNAKNKYNNMSLTLQDDAFRAITKKKYISINEVAIALENSINSIAIPNIGGGGVVSKGGNTSVVLPSGTNVTLPQQEKENISAIKKYSDLDMVAWAKKDIEKLVELGVVNGYNDETFRPNNSITRAEFIKIVTLSFDIQTVNLTQTDFIDVLPTDWYYPYVSGAYRDGVILGNKGNFMPNEQITRQDISVILYRIMKNRIKSTSNSDLLFVDSQDISDYAKDAVKTMSIIKILLGTQNGEFLPFKAATRAESCAMIVRCLNFSTN